MTKRMLIDATHAEETRVVVLDGTRLEDFDVETSTKRQLKGNIYLAKVVRVEPSLQAAFVEYGGNRHGFLAFSEIHPDYYQIPVADRQRLLEMQAEEARREEEEDDLELALSQATDEPEPVHVTPVQIAAEAPPSAVEVLATETPEVAEAWASAATPRMLSAAPDHVETSTPAPAVVELTAPAAPTEAWAKPDRPALAVDPAPLTDVAGPRGETAQPLAIEVERIVALGVDESELDVANLDNPGLDNPGMDVRDLDNPGADFDEAESDPANADHIETLPPPETIGGGDHEGDGDQRERRMPPRFLRNYKIQEVIRRRQILLVQVVKEERGTKGAALTTYLSLAGRFGVLMPNSPRGGGISRKITSATDRRRLKEVMAELDIPRGMGMIVRTAGANRPKPEIKRDCEYLLRLWDDIREHTMKSVAPALIYEEASLIKRAIRDVYSRDIDEILVDGEEGWHAAHDFMRMLMPSHAKKVQLWRDGGQPLFARSQVEAQLDSMLMPTVQLRSGGYLVINQAEALVAIDVNSGRSTRERNIEETALRTNLEAADEIARQLRLRDLAGLIVIDFIDMESKRHNAMVERRIKEALKNDRARIQVGHISHFGLLEMSRQRLRPSLAETSFIPCPHCGGTGHVRSTENAAIHVLRGIEDEGGKRRSAEIIVHVSTPVALYLLNHKRERLREIELRYTMRVIIAADDAQIAPQFRIEKVRTRSPDEVTAVVTAERSMAPPLVADVEEDEEEEPEAVEPDDEDDDAEEDTPEQHAANAAGGGDEAERRRKRRRRRRRGGRRDEQPAAAGSEAASTESANEPAAEAAGQPVRDPAAPAEASATEISATEISATETGATETGLTESGATETGDPDAAPVAAAPAGVAETAENGDPTAGETAEAGEAAPTADDEPPNRRRGRRGGRRRRRENDTELSPFAVPGADQPELRPVYAGPTPADPFGGRAFDIFDVMDQVERAAEAHPAPRMPEAQPVLSEPKAQPVLSEPKAQPVLSEPEARPVLSEPKAQPVPAEPEALPETRAPRLRPASRRAAAHPVVQNASAAEIVGDAAGEPGLPDAPHQAAEPQPRPEAALPTAATIAQPDMAQATDPTPAIVNTTAAEPAAHVEAAADPQPPAAAQPTTAADPLVPDGQERMAPKPVIPESAAPGPEAADEQAAPRTDSVTADNESVATPAETARSEPLIKPILVGADAGPPQEKKRGWWRR